MLNLTFLWKTPTWFVWHRPSKPPFSFCWTSECIHAAFSFPIQSERIIFSFSNPLQIPPSSGRWIGLLIGIEMLIIVMRPCIHFVPRAHLSFSFFCIHPNWSFPINPRVHCKWLPNPNCQNMRIHYLVILLLRRPFVAILSPASCQKINRPIKALFGAREVKKQS